MRLNNYRLRTLSLIMAYQIFGTPTEEQITACIQQLGLTNHYHPHLTKGKTYRLAKKLVEAAYRS